MDVGEESSLEGAVPPPTTPLSLVAKPIELLISPDSQNNNRAEQLQQRRVIRPAATEESQQIATAHLHPDGLLYLSTVDHSTLPCADELSDNWASDQLPSVSSVKFASSDDQADSISFRVTAEPLASGSCDVAQRLLNVCLSCRQTFSTFDGLLDHGETAHQGQFSRQRTNDPGQSAMLIDTDEGLQLRFLQPNVPEGNSQPQRNSMTTTTTTEGHSSPTALRAETFEPDAIRPEIPISPEELARNLKLASEMSASRILHQKAVRQANFQQFGSFDRTSTPCQLHPEGKSAGVECPKCEMVLGSSRSLGGHITMMHSRNSCKTLKCPKCNWHYKYQETLEIHMKEKHPENDVSCIYCLTNQSHPRLARGETYGCGYKPYRCDICKYSTTTKGNLSIHMQSDKHLNNVQELQQGKLIADPTALIHIQPAQSPIIADPPTTPTTASVAPTPTISNTPAMAMGTNKAKPSWRCDVCNYETNVARNLRIHMTSEKHTHNSLLLQQNISQLQQGLVANLTTPTSAVDQLANAELDMFSGDKSLDNQMESAHSLGAIGSDSRLYQCCVCCTFDTDSLDDLLAHIHADRSQTNETDITVVAGNYVCNLCQYRTHLKANFQLHTKTDKHLQRLQLVNHIREGGSDNEWRMKYLSSSNPIQLRCNGCYEFTNSFHKLQMHTTTLRHECYTRSFQDIQQTECLSDTQYYFCYLCSYASQKRDSIIGHLHSARHGESMGKILANVSGESALESAHNWIQLKEMRDSDNVDMSEDENDEPDQNCQPDELLLDQSDCNSDPTANMTDDAIHCCSHCDFTAATEALLRSHIGEKHGKKTSLSCPLCQSECGESLTSIEKHLEEVHNVKPEAIERLMMLLPSSSGEEANLTASSPEGTESFACPTCCLAHSSLEDLYSHQLEAEHLELKATPRGPSYLCWQKGCNQYFPTTDGVQTHFREIHAKRNLSAYKFRCGQCSLAFRSEDKLDQHSQYHQLRDATKCSVCGRNFRSLEGLKKHLAISHVGVTAGDQQRLKLVEEMSNSPMTESIEDPDGSRSECDSEINAAGENVSPSGGEISTVDEYLNSQQMAEGNYPDPQRKFKCHRCKVAFTKQTYLTAHNKTLLHRRGEKLNFSLEKYLDPSRPYKCDVCKESFTQKNILVVHYNSVSHLHRLKKSLQEQNPSGTPQPSVEEEILSSLAATNSPATTASVDVLSKVIPTPTIATVNGEDKLAKQQTPSPQSVAMNTVAKPFKCNICRVSFGQSSTLDIHMRSVAHQSRSNKLKELIAAGEINVNEPLIEKGESRSTTKKILGGVIAQKQLHQQQQQQQQSKATPTSTLNSTQTSTMMALANMASLAPYLSAQGLQGLSNSLLMGQMVQNSMSSAEALVHLSNLSQLTCRACGIICSNKEGLEIHQKNVCKSATHQPDPVRINSETPGSEDDPMDVDYSRHSQLDQSGFSRMPSSGRSLPKSRIYHKLLEDYGFEVVMQYNESLQRTKRKRDEGEPTEDVTEEKHPKIEVDSDAVATEPVEAVVNNKENQPKNGLTMPPEMTKCFCGQCQKQFSSIWVLKSHIEQAHRELVPSEEIDKVTEEFREAFEKKRQHHQAVSNSIAAEKVVVAEPSCTPTSVITAAVPSPAKTELTRSSSGKSVISHTQSAANSLSSAQQHFLTSQYQSNQAALAQVAAMANLQSFGSSGGFLGWPFGFGSPFMPFMQGSFDAATGQMDNSQSGGGRSAGNNAAMAAAAAAAAANQQKRARTRITDDQLKVLREYFDINNSPSEEQVEEMSRKSGLPSKVIKHWFRNTLFKERQKNKDSPYNFSVPPTFSIDLEEYEKTGETRVTSINPPILPTPIDPIAKVKTEPTERPTTTTSVNQLVMENGQKPNKFAVKQELDEDLKDWTSSILNQTRPTAIVATEDKKSKAMELPNTPMSTPSPSLPNETLLQRLTTNMPPSQQFQRPTGVGSDHDSTANSISQLIASALSPGSDSLTSPGGRRANRTRFSDEQLRILQEFFERNAYPKDDDLETLSKQLGLSPRVIVVWFQNARQKARKLYENQPAEPDERFIRTPGLNYECKKCHLVFQRYYELIKHQKTLCYREEEARLAALKVTTGTNGSDGASGSNYSPTNSCGDESDSELMNNSHVIKCEKCHAVFISDAQLSAHLRSHHEPEGIQTAAEPIKIEMAEVVKPTATPKHNISDLTIEYSMQEGGPKRQRTQILPEQLDLLYQKYSADSNPSGKNLEQISIETGLNKRVVQVWFQNTRARDRKGQLSQQLFNKRCPFCGILFHSKPSMEGHIRERHVEQGLRGSEVNIDQLPNAEEVPTITTGSSDTEGVKDPQTEVVQSLLSLGMLPTSTSDILAKMATELQNKPANQDLLYWLQKATGGQTSTSAATGGGEPMDLSSIKVAKNGEANCVGTASSIGGNLSENAEENDDDTQSSYSYETHSPQLSSPQGGFNRPQKRFRTHLSSGQIKIMKELFADYKTPTMSECELLGTQIGLHKRVVQVWFQNARAKERKKLLDPTADIHHPTPEGCKPCGMVYSAKHSVQDHIFTRGHIDKLRGSLKESERHKAEGNSTQRASGTNSAVLEQLQATLATNKSLLVANHVPSVPSGSSSGRKRADPSTAAAKTQKSTVNGGANEFDDLSLLPLMYASGQGGMGLNPAALYASLASSMMSSYGALQGLQGGGLLYDPNLHGTPVQMLQIPPAVMQIISVRMQNAKIPSVKFTQDGKTFDELKSSKNGKFAAEVEIEVGWGCRTCHTVFPSDALYNHHKRMVCQSKETAFKLIQIHYECVACSERFGAQVDFKSHCDTPGHKAKVANFRPV